LAKDPAARFADAQAMRLSIEDFTVAQHLPASSAHLVAFMRQLYAERIAAEADPAGLDQLAPNTDLDPASNPSSPRADKTPTSGPGAARSPSKQSKAVAPSTAVAPPPGRTSRAAILLGGALGFLLLGAGAGVIVKLTRKSADAPEPKPVEVSNSTVQRTEP